MQKNESNTLTYFHAITLFDIKAPAIKVFPYQQCEKKLEKYIPAFFLFPMVLYRHLNRRSFFIVEERTQGGLHLLLLLLMNLAYLPYKEPFCALSKIKKGFLSVLLGFTRPRLNGLSIEYGDW